MAGIMESILDRRWWHGGPREIWIQYADIAGKIITDPKNGLKPVPMEDQQLQVSTSRSAQTANALYPWWYRGGMRVPHLHYRGDIYMVNKELWKQFTDGVLKDFSKKLAGPGTVSFGQLMGLSEAVNEVI